MAVTGKLTTRRRRETDRRNVSKVGTRDSSLPYRVSRSPAIDLLMAGTESIYLQTSIVYGPRKNPTYEMPDIKKINK